MFYLNPLEIAQNLTRYFLKLGITPDEYITLNAYLNHPGLMYDNPNLNEIANSAGKSPKEVKEIFQIMLGRQIIDFDEEGLIDLKKLNDKLREVRLSTMSLNERIAEDIDTVRHMGYYNEYSHIGNVTLIPIKSGGIAVARSDQSLFGSYMWNVEDMRKLSKEILEFADATDEKWIDAYNQKIKEKIQLEREQEEVRYKERQEEKIKRTEPKPGIVILFQVFPSGLYKFSYSTSVSLQHKINLIKEQNGDNTEIVHTFETYDTMKFYYQFIKKQYSNRLVDTSWYELTVKDIENIRAENFPANALDWLHGNRNKEIK
ncbi:hypothetical protein ACH0BF_08965 [Pseudobacillus sp. 179-B 2D1 NHS]|uniref:hypothetical protein n=1 Tax=Pseudobacillus sp. 179-B 2D1 NHS TaxID=3374292 RepID=UPI00387A5C08